MNYQPINQKEQSVKDQLIKNGLEENQIEFRGSFTNPNNRYIRYGYWKPLTENDLKGTDLIEDIYEDDDGDDRGRPIIRTLYSYIIKK